MSKISPKFYGEVVKGRLVFADPMALSVYLGCFKEGAEVEVVIKRRRKKRSLNQNDYYWGYVIEVLGEHFGYWKDEMHEALKMLFLKVKREGKPDTVKSTAKLSTAEMEEYLSNIKIWASSEYKIILADPNQDIDWG